MLGGGERETVSCVLSLSICLRNVGKSEKLSASASVRNSEKLSREVRDFKEQLKKVGRGERERGK